MEFKQIKAMLEKRFGEGVVIVPAIAKIQKLPRISTGSLTLDICLGGGIPQGRITEIYGPESSGKTSLAISILREAQKEGIHVVYVDMENAIDFDWLQKIGVDVEKVFLVQAESAEEACDIVQAYLESDEPVLIVIDSIASMTPQVEIDEPTEKQQMGLQPRLVGKGLRKWRAAMTKKRKMGRVPGTIIAINQIRMKIGVMYGSPETTPAGLALKFYATVRVRLHPKGQIKASKIADKNEGAVGIDIGFRIPKNKTAPPFRSGDIEFFFCDYKRGEEMVKAGHFGKINDLISWGEYYGIIEKRGSWYSYNGETAQGFNSMRDLICNNSELNDLLGGAVMEAFNAQVDGT